MDDVFLLALFTDVTVLPRYALAACNLKSGRHRHPADLALDKHRPAVAVNGTPIPKSVNVAKWREYLASYPGQAIRGLGHMRIRARVSCGF